MFETTTRRPSYLRSLHPLAIVSFVSLVGLAASAVVHLLALVGVDLTLYIPGLWFLHFGAMAMGVALAFSPRIQDARGRHFWKEVLGQAPQWARVAVWLCFAWALLNFLANYAFLPYGVPDVNDGRYVLNNHGRLREISLDEYRGFRAHQARLFSAYWVTFYLIPAVYFLFSRKTR